MPATDYIPSMKVEVALDTQPLATSPTWTNLSSRARQGIKVTRGRDTIFDRHRTGTANLILDNQDNNLDPNDTGGTYFGKLKPLKRIRITAPITTSNLLTYSQSSVEDGISGWGNTFATCTLAHSSTQALNGRYSLQMTAAGGNMQCDTNVGTRPSVTVGTTYTAVAYFRTDATARSCRVNINWFDGAGTGLSATTGSTITDSTTGWTLATVTGTAPANAATACVTVEVLSPVASEVHRVDKVALRSGTSTVWDPGAVDKIIFDGFIEAWPQRWDSAKNGYVPISAVDNMALLSLVQLPSPWDNILNSHTPTTWYQFDEDTNTGILKAKVGVDGRFRGSPAVNISSLVPTKTRGTAITWTSSSGAGWAEVGEEDTGAGTTVFTPGTVGFWISTDINTVGNHIIARADGASLTVGQHRFAIWLDGATGRIYFRNEFGAVDQEIRTTAINDGQPHFICITCNQGVLPLIYVDGVDVTDRIVNSGGICSYPTLTHLRIAEGLIGESATWTKFADTLDEFFSIGSTTLTPAQVLALYKAGTEGWPSEQSGTRIGRVLDIAGIPAALRDLDTGSSLLLPSDSMESTTALSHIQDIEASENGRFYAAPNGKATWIQRHATYTDSLSNTAQINFVDATNASLALSNKIEFRTMEMAEETLLLRTEVRVTPKDRAEKSVEDATAIADYGRRTLDLSPALMADANEATDAANWHLSKRKVPLQFVQKLTVTPTSWEIWVLLLTLDIGHRVRVYRTPTNGVQTIEESLVEAIEMTITPGAAAIVLTLSPADTNPVWLLGVAGFSELGQTTYLGY